ncbi:hypothetical protein SOVF_190520, partial [Spinacia oleracea]
PENWYLEFVVIALEKYGEILSMKTFTHEFYGYWELSVGGNMVMKRMGQR